MTLLGPQRFTPVVGAVVRSIAPDGPVVTITAGWREREPADVELDELLEGRTANLGLYWRRLEVYEGDPELAAADERRRAHLAELADAYRLRLHHGLEAVYALQRRARDSSAYAEAIDEAIAAVRALDAWHLAQVADAHAEFSDTWPLDERPAVAGHRREIAELLDGAAAVTVAGGHVDVLLACLHLFNVAPALTARPVVAWSAGAMALSERVVVFHDRAPQGPGHAEVFDAGLGLYRGIVVLPHARRRLRLDDHGRMAVFARRFTPAQLVVLDDGARVDCGSGGRCDITGVPVVGDDGALVTGAAA